MAYFDVIVTLLGHDVVQDVDRPIVDRTVRCKVTPEVRPDKDADGIRLDVRKQNTDQNGAATFKLVALAGVYYTFWATDLPPITISGDRNPGEIVRLEDETDVTPAPIPPAGAAALRAELSAALAELSAYIDAQDSFTREAVDGKQERLPTSQVDDRIQYLVMGLDGTYELVDAPPGGGGDGGGGVPVQILSELPGPAEYANQIVIVEAPGDDL